MACRVLHTHLVIVFGAVLDASPTLATDFTTPVASVLECDTADRDAYFKAAWIALHGRDLIFLDPDDGSEVQSVRTVLGQELIFDAIFAGVYAGAPSWGWGGVADSPFPEDMGTTDARWLRDRYGQNSMNGGHTLAEICPKSGTIFQVV